MRTYSRILAPCLLVLLIGNAACTKKALPPEAPNLTHSLAQAETVVEAQQSSAAIDKKVTITPTIERLDEETARFVGSNGKVITDGKAVELASFSIVATVLVAKEEKLFQVKTEKALEIPAVEISTVGKELTLDVEVDDLAEFAILVAEEGANESSRCLVLKGKAAGILAEKDSAECWTRKDELSTELKIKAAKLGFSLSLSGEKLKETLKKFPLLSVKVRSAPLMPEPLAALPTTKVEVPVPPLPVETVLSPAPIETILEAPALEEVLSESAPELSAKEDAPSLGDKIEQAQDAVSEAAIDIITHDKQIEKEAVSLPAETRVLDDQTLVKTDSPRENSEKAETVKAEAVKVEVGAEVEAAIPTIELAKEEDEIESLPIVIESYILEDILVEEKILSELKDVSPDVKTRRAQWIEKLKQRLASYKEKKRSFEDSKKDRNNDRSGRKKVRVELAEAKKLAGKNCAVSKSKKKLAAPPESCVKAQAQVADLEKNDQKLTDSIKDLKNILDTKKIEANDDLKLVREAQASLKAIKNELKMVSKK
jgi:hypothetical protein